MIKDILGVEIKVGDTVRVTSWGGRIRLVDCGSTTVVTGFTGKGYLTHNDPQVAHGRALYPHNVAVQRRDGKPGHEGNAR